MLYGLLITLSPTQDNDISSLFIKILLLILGIAVTAFLIAFIKKKISSDQNKEDTDFFEDDNSYDNIHDNLSDVKLSRGTNSAKNTNNSNENTSNRRGQVLSSSGMRYDKSAEKGNKIQVSGGFGAGFSERDNIPEQSDDKTVELTVSHDGSWVLPDGISDKRNSLRKTTSKNDDCYRNDSIFFGDDYF